MKLIGLEEHWWSDELSTALRSVTGEAHDDSIDLFVTPEIERKLQDLDEGRLAAMQNSGIDMQVLSVSTPATQGLTPTDAVPMARDLNEQAAAAAARRPDSFAAFATLPMPDPAAAAGELERAVSTLGMVGAMIHGRTGDRMLDDPAFDDVFAMAERLRVPIYIHPQIPPRAVRHAYYGGFDPVTADGLATGAWGWHMEAGLAALRLILRGTFDRYPDLTIILGHWGEMLPFWLDRVNEISPFVSLERSIGEYVRHNIYVTPAGIFKHHLLQQTIDIIGVDRILFSTDYPFQYAPDGGARRFLETAPISVEVLSAELRALTMQLNTPSLSATPNACFACNDQAHPRVPPRPRAVDTTPHSEMNPWP